MEPSLDLDDLGQAHLAATTASTDFPVVAGPEAWPEEDNDYTLDMAIARLSPGGALLWSGYMGHPDVNELVEDLAMGPDGEIRLTGWTAPFDEEVVVSRFRPEGSGSLNYDVFVGEALDLGRAVELDLQGNSYVTGYSNSYWFPTVRPNQGDAGPFVLKLDPAMGFLDVFFFLQRERFFLPSAITLDGAGNIYITGGSPNLLEEADAWVVKLDPSGTVVWETRIGGSRGEHSRAIAVDAAGRVWVAGWTESPDFPVRGGRPFAGGRDAFLVRLTPGGALDASTLLGGSGLDEAGDLALDGRGVAYLAGSTDSADFPLTDPLPESCGGGSCGRDTFAAAFDPAGLGLTFSTRLGGSRSDEASGVAVDPAGSFLWVAGLTSSPDFPVLDAWQPELAGGVDTFVAKIALSQPLDCSGGAASPALLWPPNGKLVPVTIQGVTDPDGDPVAISVTAIRQDEPLTKESQPDATGLGTSRPQVRASRAGNGDGRVYHITFTATDPQGSSCTGAVTVCVPHGQGKRTCGDGGALVGSTGNTL